MKDFPTFPQWVRASKKSRDELASRIRCKMETTKVKTYYDIYNDMDVYVFEDGSRMRIRCGYLEGVVVKRHWRWILR